MASEIPNWRVRTSLDSSYIIGMNRLLREDHVLRICETPFRWCVYLHEKVDINCELIKVMSEWYVGERVRDLPEIKAAFELFDGGIGVPQLPKRCRVNEAVDDSSDDGTFEANLEETLKKNNEEMMALSSRLVFLKNEVCKIREIPIVDEEGVGGLDEEPLGEEGVGGVDEEPLGEEGVGGVDEEPLGEEGVGRVGEEPLVEEGVGVVDEEPLGGEEGVGGVHEEPLGEGVGGVHEEPLGEGVGGVHQEPLGGASNEEPVAEFEQEVQKVIKIVEIVEYEQSDAPQPMAIEPLRAVAGDPRPNVNADQLYIAVGVRDRPHR
ncbi:uncharacterized protein LOC111241861 [Vigna radiata var. radiata]|uniref:Uncharacterized protein LOC111241861 n=1 Tax=Vigna radiata var. radiata TaxID=3916 RepID=A0A3Q0F5N2_VIGRR|nr:uncharacterized protein LOC111241861 [Vigna radiata var. radiata]